MNQNLKDLSLETSKVDEEELDEVEVQSDKEQPVEGKFGKEKFNITIKEDDKGPLPEIQLIWDMSEKDIAKIETSWVL